MSRTRAIVVGGLGYLGVNLTTRLLDEGMTVTVLTPSRARHVAAADELERRGVRVADGDVRAADTVRPALRDQDIVFHLAGRSGAVRSVEDPAGDLDVNLTGSLVLLEAIREVCRDAKVVFVGSRLEYGRTGDAPVAEDHPLEPRCPHGVNKLAVERYLALYANLFGLRYTVARVTNPYGPGQPRSRTAYGVVNRMIHLALGDAAIPIYGDGSQRRDYIYLDDVSAALVALARSDRANGRAYNVATGLGTRLVDMAERIRAIAGGGRLERVPWPPIDHLIETGDFVADIGRIEHEIGWRPSVSLDAGLERTVAFYRAHVAS